MKKNTKIIWHLLKALIVKKFKRKLIKNIINYYVQFGLLYGANFDNISFKICITICIR